MKATGTKVRKALGGFTLAEMAVAMGIGAAVVAGMLSLFVTFLRSYNKTTLIRNTTARSSLALERMVYGVGTNYGLREAQSSSVSLTYPTNGWQLSYTTNQFFRYTAGSAQKITDQSGKAICTNVIASTATNFANSCRISITVAESAGGRAWTSTVSTLVQYRN
jgi:type II secretory pathway pseudopilin PulG